MLKTCSRAVCPNKFKPEQSKYKYCPACRDLIRKRINQGRRDGEIEKELGIKSATINSYRRQIKKAKGLPQTPDKHVYFNYRDRLKKHLAKLAKKTGIKDWNSPDGQAILRVDNDRIRQVEQSCFRQGTFEE